MVLIFGVGLSTVFTVIKLEFVTVRDLDKTSPTLLVSDWSATAVVIVFVIEVPLVLALTVAVISKETFALEPIVPMVQRPVESL